MVRLSKVTGAVLTVLIAASVISSAFAATVNLTVNGGVKQDSVPHFWSRCVGTGGADLCLKKEWLDAAKMGVNEAGFKAFRGHRLLCASNPISWKGSGTPTYNWTTFDKIYDILVDTLKTVPVVELSDMPPDLQTSGEWSPPKNFDIWGDLIKNVVSHLEERYGKEKVRTWFFEVWNEYDYAGFWSGGTKDQYFQLYKKAVEAAKSVDSLIMIGGPSTTGSYNIGSFLDYCKANNVKVDLVTNHCYGGGGPGPNADAQSIRDDNRTRANEIKRFGKKMFSLNTEYNSSYSGQGGNTQPNCISMDSHVNAPFVVKCVKLILDDAIAPTPYQLPDVLSYWVISDVFDEGSFIERSNLVPFGEVFGMINYQGVRKATFNAFKMLHMMGTTRLQLSGGTGTTDGVDGFATVSANGSEVAVIVYNFYKVLSGQTGEDQVNITLNDLPLPKGQISVQHFRVDSLHSNPYAVWLKQGKPAKPSTTQWDEMRAAQNLAELQPAKNINYTGTALTETFTLPRQSVSLLLFKSSNGVIDKAHLSSSSTKAPAISITGTILRAAGTGENPMDVGLYRLDGKCIKHIKVTGDCDLRQLLPKGTYIIHAKVRAESITGKVAIN
jgi:xylan 1,4-beta-xylosidase